MKIKVIFILLFIVAIIGIIAPVNAALQGNVEIVTPNPSDGTVSFSIGSDIGMKDENPYTAKRISQRTKETNKVKKIVIQIRGFKPITFKRPQKGWSDGLTYFSVNGTAYNKAYSMKLYDKNNELLKNIKGYVRWTHNCLGYE